MDCDAPLLFFDSGVGGLSVLGPTRALLPTAPIVYAADNAWFPYGKRSETELAEHVPSLLAQLAAEYSPRLIVIACNTASTIALDHARSALDVPIVGTVPAIKPAAEVSNSRVIGVLGTEATVRQPYVDDLAARFASDCTLVRHGSPELVQLAEDKLRGLPVAIDAVRAAIAPMVETGPGMDVMVLACTHFPLLSDEIAAAFPDIRRVDGAAGIARRIAFITKGQPWPEIAPRDIAVFSGAAPDALIPALARFGLTQVKSLSN
jgi:glutamate racemase